VTPQDISSFSPGRYEVEVSLKATALSAPAVGLANILVRRILFEIRQPKTDAELVDAYLQRSYDHLRAGDAKSARDYAQMALRLNPASLPALTDVGAAWLLAGNCEQAVAAYRQALPLITGGADNELKISEPARHEWASNLRAKIASRCGAR
jgi:tetratricopeptide (TPR) repeat protein